ncbi:Mur ligase family protein [Halorussus litoreus]|uniref:Mur ligase family protein n=1 Tax=Halorussus litoreus TaxID=1710536 RepID=UPI0018E4E474|nr:Mur ligase family protein [Halorussus litoreus]
MSRTGFEIYGRGFGWSWRLRNPAEVLATGSRHYDTSRGAREAVDIVRAAVAELSGADKSFPDTDVDTPEIIVEQEPTPSGELPDRRNNWVWRLKTANGVLGHSADRFPTEISAKSASEQFLNYAAGALPMFLVGAEYEWKTGPKPIEVGSSSLSGLVSEVTRGVRHRNILNQIDTKIVVSGTRGKSSTTQRLDDVFNRREYDTLTKITGNHPLLIHNGEVHPIERRGPRTTLYENISLIAEFVPELDAYEPDDVAIFENQGITGYTTRLFNQRLTDPDIIVLTNVRQDHTDTLGKTRTDLARSFARSVPAGTHVVSGEQHPVLHEYMQNEIERRGGTIEQVEIPPEHEGLIGSETIHAVDAVLDAVGEPPLPTEEIESFLRSIQPTWIAVEGGRIFNAAEVNDVESTEMVRRVLVDDEYITPFVYLRRDRRGRTASFAQYIELLFERDVIEEVHAGGANTRAFAENIDVPTECHSRDADPDQVLTELLATGRPVILMGNTVDEFMRDIQASIERRVKEKRKATGDSVVNR